PKLTGVPTPWQSQMPGPSVRAEQGTERAKLKPSHVQFAGVFLRWNKPADVCSPVRDAAQSGVNRNGNMSTQRFPRSVDIARPEKRAVALHTRMAVAMKSVGTLVGAIKLRAFIVHSNSRESRSCIQRVTFIRPPPIDSERERLSMKVPVAPRFFFIESRQVARIAHRSAKPPREYHVMEHHSKIQRVELVQHSLWIGED